MSWRQTSAEPGSLRRCNQNERKVDHWVLLLPSSVTAQLLDGGSEGKREEEMEGRRVGGKDRERRGWRKGGWEGRIEEGRDDVNTKLK